MGFFSRKEPNSPLVVTWAPFTPPQSGEQISEFLTLSDPMLEREPERVDDYIDFGYLDNLPETSGITSETLIATGPSHLLFSDSRQEAKAFLTDERLVHLALHRGLYRAIGARHEDLLGIRSEGPLEITVNWSDPRCPVLGMAPRVSRDGLANRHALEWYYSFAQIAKDILR